VDAALVKRVFFYWLATSVSLPGVRVKPMSWRIFVPRSSQMKNVILAAAMIALSAPAFANEAAAPAAAPAAETAPAAEVAPAATHHEGKKHSKKKVKKAAKKEAAAPAATETTPAAAPAAEGAAHGMDHK